MKKVLVIVSAAILVFVLSACGSSGGGANGTDNASAVDPHNNKPAKAKPIVIGGKVFTEQRILPYIEAEYIEAKTDYQVKVHENIGSTSVITQAMKDGDIDMYVGYTGDGYLDILKKKYKPSQTADQVFQATKKGYEKKYNITWLAPLGFQNTYTLATRQDIAKKYNIKKASDFVGPSKNLTFAAPATFFGRADGFDYMNSIYHFHFKGTKKIKAGLMYDAVANNQVDVIPAFTTDARIDKLNLATTVDDKHAFPPYYAAPIVRMDTLKSHPGLKKVINQLKGKISNKEMRHMNGEVDIHKKRPKEVAKEFLKSKGLIK